MTQNTRSVQCAPGPRSSSPDLRGGEDPGSLVAPRGHPHGHHHPARLTDDGVDADGELGAQDQRRPPALPGARGMEGERRPSLTQRPRVPGALCASPDLLVETLQVILLLQQGQVEVQVVAGRGDLQRAVLQLGMQTAGMRHEPPGWDKSHRAHLVSSPVTEMSLLAA